MYTFSDLTTLRPSDWCSIKTFKIKCPNYNMNVLEKEKNAYL